LALVHPLLALALVVVAGIGVTRLSRPQLRYPALLHDVLATGAPFLVLGLIIGPGLGVIDAAGLRMLEPVVALGIGWAGAVFGLRLEWRMVRRISFRTWLVGASLALPVAATTTVMAVILARAFPGLGDSWGHPSLPVALAIGGALTTAASHQGPRLGRRNALLDTALGTAAVALAVALYHPHLAVRSILFTVIGGLVIGGLFVGVARWVLGDAPSAGDVTIATLAVILAGAGFSYAARLSPFVVCALAVAVFSSSSPPAVRHAVAGVLTRWELPLYALFLMTAGALLGPMSPWIVLAAPVLALLRLVVRWITVRFGLDQVDPVWRSLPFAPPREFAHSNVRQGAAAVALAAGFDLVRAGPGALLVTVLLSVMVAEALAAWTPLTVSPRQAEVS
jgi:hypothetical protein